MDKQITNFDWTNFVEIRAYGLMRSGNHAIIEWVQNQHSGHITCFLNNVKHGDYDPYKNHKLKVLTGIDGQIDIEVLRRMRKRLLLYSYEDQDELEANKMTFLDSVFQKAFDKNRKDYLGASRHKLDLMIIRDPFNFLASRLKLLQVRGPLGGVSNLELIVKNWKILAREALKLTHNPQPGKMVANYNRWATNPSYRKRLSQLVMGNFDDTSMNNISQFGGGSSFRDPDKLTMGMIMVRWKKLFNIKRYARLGHYWRRLTTPDIEKKVFERWKYFATDERFMELVLDKELLELSEELFGKIPGIREFVKIMQRK